MQMRMSLRINQQSINNSGSSININIIKYFLYYQNTNSTVSRIIIIIGLQPSGRFLAPTPSISPYPQPSSSFLHTRISLFPQYHYLLVYLNHYHLPLNLLSLPLGHLSFLSLIVLAVFSPLLSPPSHPSVIHPLSAHVLSNSFSFDLF